MIMSIYTIKLCNKCQKCVLDIKNNLVSATYNIHVATLWRLVDHQACEKLC